MLLEKHKNSSLKTKPDKKNRKKNWTNKTKNNPNGKSSETEDTEFVIQVMEMTINDRAKWNEYIWFNECAECNCDDNQAS